LIVPLEHRFGYACFNKEIDRSPTCLPNNLVSKKAPCISNKNNLIGGATQEPISRVIWGTGRPIAAITIPSSKKIIFCDLTEKTIDTQGIEAPAMFDTTVIGCFSSDGLLFACACRTWKNQIIIIDCTNAATPHPVKSFSICSPTDTISSLDWSNKDALSIQVNWNTHYVYLDEKSAPKTIESVASAAETKQEANQAWIEGLLSNLHAQ